MPRDGLGNDVEEAHDSLIALPAWVKGEKRLSSMLPYVSLVTDRTIRARGNELMQCIRLEGVNSTTSEDAHLDRIGGLLAGIVAQVGTEFSFYLHKVSKAVDVSLPPILGEGFAAAVDQRWRAHLGRSGLRDKTLTQHYVVVIPQQYNRYLAAVGGIDALGTIDPVLLANASFSLSAHGAGVYGDYSLVSVQAAALRVQDIIRRIGETEDIHEATQLNTYARAELARLVAIRTRIKAAHTQPLSEEQLAMAAAQAAERQFMNFTLESLR
ncbi:MAG: hypothetical protein ACK4F5_17340 [Aliihoeflea sp.]